MNWATKLSFVITPAATLVACGGGADPGSQAKQLLEPGASHTQGITVKQKNIEHAVGEMRDSDAQAGQIGDLAFFNDTPETLGFEAYVSDGAGQTFVKVSGSVDFNGDAVQLEPASVEGDSASAACAEIGQFIEQGGQTVVMEGLFDTDGNWVGWQVHGLCASTGGDGVYTLTPVQPPTCDSCDFQPATQTAN